MGKVNQKRKKGKVKKSKRWGKGKGGNGCPGPTRGFHTVQFCHWLPYILSVSHSHFYSSIFQVPCVTLSHSYVLHTVTVDVVLRHDCHKIINNQHSTKSYTGTYTQAGSVHHRWRIYIDVLDAAKIHKAAVFYANNNCI